MQLKIEKHEKYCKDLIYDHKKEIDALTEKIEFEKNQN